MLVHHASARATRARERFLDYHDDADSNAFRVPAQPQIGGETEQKQALFAALSVFDQYPFHFGALFRYRALVRLDIRPQPPDAL
jgi:hypothetical protein